MTPTELLALIDSDAEATSLANAGNDTECAVRCTAIAPKVRVPTVLTRKGLYDKIGMAFSIPILMKLEAYAASQETYAYGVADFLSFLIPSNGGADFANPDLLLVASGFLQSQIFSQAEFDAINNLSMASQTITAQDVGYAMAARRTTGE